MASCQNGREDSGAPSPKKLKINDVERDSQEKVDLQLKDFEPEKVLSNNTNRKSVCIVGKFKEKDGRALVLLEKKAFQETDLGEKGYFGGENRLEELFQNDIYGNYECFPPERINGVKTTIIYPVTEKHIQKFVQQDIYIIKETPELYTSVTLPHIEAEQFDLKWVQNILNGTKEADRIVFNNTDAGNGFVLLPDLKWDGKTLETLYLVAIVRRTDIKSLRDLDESHLPLLRTIRDEGIKAIEEKYGLRGEQLRIYIHYQPSYYHLHVHFTFIKHDAPGIYTEKSHLLDTVINNIEMMGDYYKRATLPFVLKEMDTLFKKYEEKGAVTKCNTNN